METTIFTDENGQDFELYVLEETVINETRYIICAEGEDDESTAYLMKETGDSEDDATYELVEDDNEFEAVMKVFAELMDDTDFE